MKKFTFLMLTVALTAVTVVTGCRRDPVDQPTDKPARDVVTAVIEQAAAASTRTHIEWETVTGTDGTVPVVKWTDGDKIVLIADHPENASLTTPSTYTFTQSTGETPNPAEGGVYTFGLDAGQNVVSGANYAALYPASMLYAVEGIDYIWSKDVEPNVVTLCAATAILPRTQTYAVNGGGDATFANGSFPMIAWGTSKQDMQFKHGCGLWELNINSSGEDVAIKSIKFEVPVAEEGGEGKQYYPAGEKTFIAAQESGDVYYSFSISNIEAADAAVTLDCGDGVTVGANTPKKFFLILPPNTYTDFTLTITTTAGTVMTNTFAASENNQGLKIERAAVTKTSLTFAADPVYTIGLVHSDKFYALDQAAWWPGFTEKLVLTEDNGVNFVADNAVTWSISNNTDSQHSFSSIDNTNYIYFSYWNNDDEQNNVVGTVSATVGGRVVATANARSKFYGIAFCDKDYISLKNSTVFTAEQIEGSAENAPLEIGMNVTAFGGDNRKVCVLCNSDHSYCPYNGISAGENETRDLTFTPANNESAPDNKFYVSGMTSSGYAQLYSINIGTWGINVWFKLVDDTTVSFGQSNYYGYPGIVENAVRYFGATLSNEAYTAAALTWSSDDNTVIRFADAGTTSGKNVVFGNGMEGVTSENGTTYPDNTTTATYWFDKSATVTATIEGTTKSATAVVNNSIEGFSYQQEKNNIGYAVSWYYSAVTSLESTWLYSPFTVRALYFMNADKSCDYIPDQYFNATSSNTDFMTYGIENNVPSITFLGAGQGNLTVKVGNATSGYVVSTFGFKYNDNSDPTNSNIEGLNYDDSRNFGF